MTPSESRDPDVRGGWTDLAVALVVTDTMQASIRHVDAKSIALLGIEGFAAGTLLDRIGPTGSSGAVPTGIRLVAVLVVIATLAVSTFHLVGSLWPRLPVADPANRFSLPDLAVHGVPAVPAGIGDYTVEAWQHGARLAKIAMRKHRHLRRSLPWLTAATATSVLLALLG
ncbi:hypothetical protein [Catellatospora methionotrophica]|uniref:hypothetical protein n=1 Tax=Catellatospora methionotrophica TaxID=121620 RepID=UPI0033DDFB5D